MPIKRPERKIALLIGVEDYGSAGYDTLERVGSDLNTLKARLTGDGFVTVAVRGKDAANRASLQTAVCKAADELLQLQQHAAGVCAGSAHSTAAVSQEGNLDPSSTFAVVYYSGHGTVDASTGESCMVAGDGSVVPIPVVQQLFQDVGWLVMLFDACRNVSAGQQEAAADTNEQQQQQQAQQQQQQTQQQQQQQLAQQLPLNADFSIKHRRDQHNLIAYSCKYAATARDGLFTDELLKAWSPTKSVFHTITDATSALENTRGQWSTVDMSGGASKSFVLFSFHQNLLQGKLNASPVALQGRDSERQLVRSTLLEDRLCVIEGGPGEGKTALAETVGQLMFNAGKYPGGVYKVDFRGIDGGVQASFAQQLANHLCDEGCVPPLTGQDPWEVIQRWLRDPSWKDQPALILIDNADEALGHEEGVMELRHLLQTVQQLSGTAAVMITSRCANLLALQHQPVVLQPLQQAAAVKLLKERCTRNLEQQPAEVLQELCVQVCRCNPLMLLFVAAAISDGGLCKNIQEMLDLSHPGGALEGVWQDDDPYLSTGYMDSLKRWWNVMLQRFLTRDELQGLAMLAIFPANFSLDAADLVTRGSLELSRQLLADLRGRRVLQSVEDLEDYYTMHPVHREVAYSMLSGQDIAKAQEGVVTHVLSLGRKLSTAQPTRALHMIEAEAVNVLAALKMPGLLDNSPGPLAAAGAVGLYKLADAVHKQCQYPLAKQLLQHALVLAETGGASDDPIKRPLPGLVMRNHLARVLMAQGDLGEAEALAGSALESAGRALTRAQEAGRDYTAGQCKEVVMMTSNTLAVLYGYKGKLEAARDLFVSMMQSTPENSYSMASLQVDLAKVYLQMGLLDEAEQCLRSALRIHRSRQRDGPETAEILVFLAHLLMQRFENTRQHKHYTEAVAMATTAHGILQTARGAHHSLYLFCVSTLAHLDRQGGEVDRAEQAHRKVMALYEVIHGPSSVEVAGSLDGTAMCLETKPEGLVEAEGMRRRSLNNRKCMLGPEHHTVASSLQSLARNLARQGTPDKLEEAEAWATQAVQTMRAARGARSQEVVPCLRLLHGILKDRSKHRAAVWVWLEMQAIAHPWRCLAASAAIAVACGGLGWLVCRKAAITAGRQAQ